MLLSFFEIFSASMPSSVSKTQKGRTMGIVQKDGKVLYAFSGRYALAQKEALQAILNHERIPFITGAGPGSVVIEVERHHAIRVREVVQQWYEAIHVVHHVVWEGQ
jgi:hypothetical protein